MSLTLASIGTALPETRLSHEEALAIARVLCVRQPEEETWLPVLYGNTGIQNRYLALGNDLVQDVLNGTRHSASVYLPTGTFPDNGPTTAQRMRHYERSAGKLATASARQALERADCDPRDVTHLITVTCTGFTAPGLDHSLINNLNLSPTVERTQIGFMGCHGALNGLRVAKAFSESQPDACILLSAVELCSLHYHYGWDPQRIIANALFADGAATVVCRSTGPPERWRVQGTGSCLIPDSASAMTWTIGEHGFEMTLSKRVPDLIARYLRPWLESWLGRQGYALEAIASWAVHPGGPKILTAVEESLHLNRDALAVSKAVLESHGNMSSPTLLFILDHMQTERAPAPCVALGFGPGLTAEAVLLDRV